ncbi:MAG: GIY-YIG nuclease family protein, partial [Cyclobacteriaceae bacterium]
MKNQANEEIYIYVLQLENDKIYVGQSIDIDRRFKDHSRESRGSKWTKLHKPIDVIKVYRTGIKDPELALKYENDITFHCIREYGWQRVRGGDYTLIDDKQHLLSLIIDSGLGNEVCPVKLADGINVLELGYKVFTLALEDGKYFVGTTRHTNLAILSELNGKGSEWTKRFTPKELVRLLPIEVPEEKDVARMHEFE